MKNEPVVTIGAITALVTALLGVLVAFGIPLTPEQQTALTTFVVSAVVLASAFIARRFVTPVAKAEEEKAEAVAEAVAEAEADEPKPRRALIEPEADSFVADEH